MAGRSREGSRPATARRILLAEHWPERTQPDTVTASQDGRVPGGAIAWLAEVAIIVYRERGSVSRHIAMFAEPWENPRTE